MMKGRGSARLGLRGAPVWWSVLLYLVHVGQVGSERFTLIGDTVKDINCGQKVIVPEFAEYGGSDPSSACVNPDAWFKVVELCYNKNACSLSAVFMIDPPTYIDPCPGENKQLEVQYSCVQAGNLLDPCSAISGSERTVIGGEAVAIVSPNYPSYYPGDRTVDLCNVRLFPPANNRDLQVTLHFIEMEARSNSIGCYDKVYVEDPGNPAKNYEFCGDAPTQTGNPSTFVVESLEVKMISDSITNKRGFLIRVDDVAWGPCTSTKNKCLNAAACTMSASGNNIHCECPPGFSGTFCELNDQCDPNPCKNNGACVPGSGSTNTCNCASGWTGPTCETASVSPCSPSPCKNGAVCESLSGAATCLCPTGYEGPTCAEATGCSKSCLNGGVCKTVGGTDYCDCAQAWGFSGANCETPCGTVNPCKNGGACVVENQQPTCGCPASYSGNECQNLVGCTLSCKNGGECTETASGYVCNCQAGFFGDKCQNYGDDDCAGNPCKNGAECVDDISDYKCVCTNGFTGKNCADVRTAAVTGYATKVELSLALMILTCLIGIITQH